MHHKIFAMTRDFERVVVRTTPLALELPRAVSRVTFTDCQTALLQRFRTLSMFLFELSILCMQLEVCIFNILCMILSRKENTQAQHEAEE